MNFEDGITAEDPPAVLLDALTLDDVHELMQLLADVRDGGQPDPDIARHLLANLASRVPSRD